MFDENDERFWGMREVVLDIVGMWGKRELLGVNSVVIDRRGKNKMNEGGFVLLNWVVERGKRRFRRVGMRFGKVKF